MKNKINYLFLISSGLIWLFTLVLFLLYIIKAKNGLTINKIIDENKAFAIGFIIVETVLVSGLIILYYYLFIHRMKKEELRFTKKYMYNIYLCTFYIALNLILTVLFSALGANTTNLNNMKVFYIIAFTLSSILLIAVGFYSFYLSVGYEYMINNQTTSARKEVEKDERN